MKSLTDLQPRLRIVVQARTNSARLPAKTLLPVGGLPLAILAARRLGRSGLDTVLATSDQPSDNALAAAARQAGLTVLRGPRDDVLERFVLACADLPDDAIVVRATGDNVIPDADFASLLVVALASGDDDIIGTRWPDDGLPYGLSLEACRVKALRRAAASTATAFDREHVTPWLWRKGKSRVFRDLSNEIDLARLRCTVDALDDYLLICRVFAQVNDPVGISWRKLVAILKRQDGAAPMLLPHRLVAGHRQSPLVLGTVQLGMTYGSVRPTLLPSEADAVAIVRRAITCGVTHLDTARAYGASEQRIGLALADGWRARVEVVTKLDPLLQVPDNAPGWAVGAAVRESILRSCHELTVPVLQTVLLHRAEHRTAWGGAAWQALLALRADGLIERLGMSVSNAAEAKGAAADPDVSHIQIPFNILDGRLDEAGVPALLVQRSDLTVHARSAFLQGILAQPALDAWPRLPGLEPGPLAGWLRTEASALGRASVADLCLAYARAQPWIHGMVVGMETVTQLDDTLALFAKPALGTEAARSLAARRPVVPPVLLNPALWPA